MEVSLVIAASCVCRQIALVWPSLKRRRREPQLPNATEFIADLARSVGFLSRIPVPDRFFNGHDGNVSRAVRAFPLAGVVVALLPALVLYLLSKNGDPLLASLVSLTVLTLITGALHEDGLADAADGLGGGRDRDHALSIMKDSRVGSYGVIALLLSYALRAAALAALARIDESLAAVSLLASAPASRALMVGHWSALSSARTFGVASSAGRPEGPACTIALVSGACIALAFLVPHAGFGTTLLALLLSTAAAAAFTRLATARLGGHTGDTIGATQQIGEIVMLAALALLA